MDPSSIVGKRPTRAVMLIAGVALAYVITGKLSLLLAIPPGYATAIFPPAGIALAALLVSGYRIWPGVLLGSLAMNLWVSFEHFHALSMLSVIVATSIAGGATLQALLGALLVRRFVATPLALDTEREIVRFILLGGPLSCLCNATIGVTTLYLAGAISLGEYPYSWWTWWVGDSIGVLIAAPLTLILIGQPREIWWPRRYTVAAPLATAISVVVVLFLRASGWENERISQQFVQRTQTLESRIKTHSADCIEVLDYLERLHASVPNMDRTQFKTFTAHVPARCPGVQAISWNWRVPANDLPAYRNFMAQQGFPEFRITDQDSPNHRVLAKPRSEYVPITFVEPYAGNEAAIGFDVFSEPIRRQALLQAGSSGKTTATARIELVQAAQKPAVVVYQPLYRPGVATATVTQRQAALQGFMALVLRLDAIVDISVAQLDPTQFAVRLRDISMPAAPELLYQRAWSSADASTAHLTWTSDIPLAGRLWRLEVNATTAYLSAYRSWQAWAVLAAGLLFTGLLGVFMLSVTGRSARTERLVQERTAALSNALRSFEESEQRFRVFVNAAPVMMWMTDARHKRQLFNDSWLQFTDHTLEQELADTAVDDAIHPEDRAHRREIYAHNFTQRSGLAQQYRMRNGSGEYRWIEEVAVPRFSLDGHFAGYIGCCLDITERKKQDELVAATLKEKELMLGEIHHRVKNNLQIIDSLLGLQSAQTSDPALLIMLRDSQNRIKSMAAIHQTLYESHDFARVDFTRVLDNLTSNLIASYAADAARIQLRIQAPAVLFSMSAAIPLALVVNELITNALKHAYPNGRRGEIRVHLTQDDGETVLTISDDGVGIPEHLNLDTSPTLGLQLVRLLSEQLRGTLIVERARPTRFTLRFRD